VQDRRKVVGHDNGRPAAAQIGECALDGLLRERIEPVIGSSNSKISASRMKARAIAMRCRCPRRASRLGRRGRVVPVRQLQDELVRGAPARPPESLLRGEHPFGMHVGDVLSHGEPMTTTSWVR